jgi:hypothetical protein
MMNKETALKVMLMLREGHDPTTGDEINLKDSIFQKSIVTRAIYASCEALEDQIKNELKMQKRREHREKNKPANQGKKWFPDEDDILKEEVSKKIPVDNIAAAHQRSRLSIEKRIEKHNLEKQRKER